VKPFGAFVLLLAAKVKETLHQLIDPLSFAPAKETKPLRGGDKNAMFGNLFALGAAEPASGLAQSSPPGTKWPPLSVFAKPPNPRSLSGKTNGHSDCR